MVSRLTAIQARFQEKQMQEKEEKLLRAYESQQQKTMERINNRASPNGRTTNVTKANYHHAINATVTTGKVRQMFDERRQKAGIDRSYPLEPLKTVKTRSSNVYVKSNVTKRQQNSLNRNANGELGNRSNSQTTVKTTIHQKVVSKLQNETPIANKRDALGNNNEEGSYENGRYVSNDSLDSDNLDNKDTEIDEETHNIGMKNKTTPKTENSTKKEPLVKRIVTKVERSNGSIKGGSILSPGSSSAPLTASVLFTTTSPVAQSPIVNQNYSNSSSANRTAPVTSTTRSPVTVVRSPHKSGSAMSQSTKTKQSEPARSVNSDHQKSPSTARPSAKPRQQPSAIVRDDLEPCRYCSRRFAPDRLAIHEDICARAGKKKRKTYDATKHRIQGTELEPYVRKKKPGKAAKTIPQPDWRKKHEEFVATIRAAKMAQAHLAKGGKISDLPPPPPSYNPDYVQCPHCGRRFNEAAAERHIPKCATYQFNKPKPKPPSTKTSNSVRSGGSVR